ncbi:glycoside hydrolase family 97 C-terminal domain-containing protein [Spirosoma horti]
MEPGKTYEVIVYRDAPNGDWATNPEAYVIEIEKKIVTAKTKLILHLAKGGCAIQIVMR